MLATATALRAEAELYLQWAVTYGCEPDRDVAAENRAILEAVVGRDAAKTEGLLRDHIAHTAELLISCAVDERNPAS